MEDYDKILQAIYEAIREVNELVDPDQKLVESPDTVLIGEDGTLDSLGLVSLATVTDENIERARAKVEDETGIRLETEVKLLGVPLDAKQEDHP